MVSKRLIVPLLLPILAGCSAPQIGSFAMGRDCSAAELEKGVGWCSPPETPPPPQPYCTAGWSGVDCWSRPDLMPNVARSVAEGPTGLTAEQNAVRLNKDYTNTPPSSQNSY
ncbi:hypothetical protein AA0472_2831 [Acetobacter estunensis NRIC 0472]|uniref:Lipoprotein n=1 Tax=Acetobacter estunensis TaxID=104097 RepID=A0A967B4B5_9PROT|nr:hypothetical protein [Acetobacter estunensis]MBV1836475.1 hypothetical protein [Acetobacter estunensis]NHO53502.1 hypothetical protein [Acetobacter estunensis]GBQ28880.1 hypothetical protein AA0472_2831 [Acetobacter estunensis NRIC 0472]